MSLKNQTAFQVSGMFHRVNCKLLPKASKGHIAFIFIVKESIYLLLLDPKNENGSSKCREIVKKKAVIFKKA
jgi:hypothetical protein